MQFCMAINILAVFTNTNYQDFPTGVQSYRRTTPYKSYFIVFKDRINIIKLNNSFRISNQYILENCILQKISKLFVPFKISLFSKCL